MAYSDRISLYQELERQRGKPLICYFTSLRNGAAGQMASDVIPEFIKQLKEIPSDKDSLDILIVSNGGDPTVSWRIMSLAREKFKYVEVLLPYTAFSAATLLALGANTIVMHPFSNLGPVDPQLVGARKIPGQGGQPDRTENFQFGSEDIRNYLDFVKTDVGISDQEQLQKSFELLCKDIGSIPIGIAKRSSQLGLMMGEQLLKLHMKDDNKVKAIAEALNKSFYHHGYPLSRSEAKRIGLPIEIPEGKIEDLMWDIWKDMETEFKCCIPFNPLEIVMNDPALAAVIGKVPQVQIPLNLPTQVLQQMLNQILNSIQVVPIDPVDYELSFATVESIRCRSEHKTKGKINAIRLPDMNIAINLLKLSENWIYTKN